MFALTQVPFIETLVIKCKTLLGTTGQQACNSYQSVCREVAGRAARALSPFLVPLLPSLLCPLWDWGCADGPQDQE